MTVLYWVDLETTGLDPKADRILEISVLASRLEQPLAAVPIYQSVVHTDLRDDQLTPFIVEMHTKNGLLADCRAVDPSWTIQKIENDICHLIPVALSYEEAPILAGSTVHFDRAFMREHMPLLETRFHHRHFDVSGMKLLCESLGMKKIDKGEAHRATPDLYESIAHLRKCIAFIDCDRPRIYRDPV